MPEFTPAQKRAIDTRGCDLLVSAAAGSGKTAVLSERVLRMLTDEANPVDIDRLLIVTFTNAAAAEMKDRISGKIADMMSRAELSAYKKSRLHRQLTLVNKASITTIHSFCLDIIRNHFHLVDIDPAFRIAEESEAQLLKLQMADKMLEEMYGGPKAALFSRLCIWLGNGKDENLADTLLRLYEFIRSFPDPFAWLHEQVEKYNPDSLTDIDHLDWIAEIKQGCRLSLESVQARCGALIQTANKNGTDFYCPALLDDLQKITLLSRLCEESWEDLYAVASSFSFVPLSRRPKDADPETAEAMMSQRNGIKEYVKKILADITCLAPDAILEGLRRAYPLLTCLEQSMASFHALYSEKKRVDAVLDFGDFEHIALRLLSDGENGVADELREKFHEIFVDEYQDCNMTQEALFSYICRRKDGLPCNMFMVGDVKQSIYKFRQADPTIFMHKSKTYGTGVTQKVVLNKNFRSSSVILDCVNHLFSRIMSEYAGEIDYNADEMLYYREDVPPEITKKDKCELLVAQPEESADEDVPETGVALEARMVANRILSLKKEGYRFKDMVVLMRGLSSRGGVFEEEFKLRGIPYYTDGGSGYFESLEVRIFISLLKVIDNPMQDIPLAGLLRSPLIGFDENELLEIRMVKKGMFYNALVQYAPTEGKTGEKCRAFLNRLSRWRDQAVSMPIDEFVDYMMEETNLYNFAAALPGGEQRKANLRLLTERARGLQSSGFHSLFSFIGYVDRLKSHSDSGAAKQLPENSDVVRMMTIHKSKGLEFPVVFLCACNARFNAEDSRGNLLLHRKLGFGAELIDAERKIRYPLVSKTAVAQRIRLENISEEMRVLYVALTRAKQKLICTASVKNAADKRASWENASAGEGSLPRHQAAGAGCYLDWISACLNENWIVRVLFVPEIQEAYHLPEAKPDMPEFPAEEINVGALLDYQYGHLPATRLPNKFSVSELKRRYDFEDAASVKLYTPPLMPSPKFMQAEAITPAGVGIVNHLILKELPLVLPTEADIARCADKLQKKGLLLESELPYINTAGILAFFKSELGRRLLASPRVFRELQFNIPLLAKEMFLAPSLTDETVLVQGIIDCLFEENGGLILIDYKTDRFLRPDVRETYENQLNIYAAAAERMTNLKVREKYLYLLTPQETVEI